MADVGHKRKVTVHDDLDHERKRSSRQPRLQTKINEAIARHMIEHQSTGRSTSESLMRGFTLHVWPKVRDDYRQMTQYLEEGIKSVLKERQIDAEVFSRVKDDVSIAKTLERRQMGFNQGKGFSSYQDIFHEMHDLSGLRIVLMDREDQARTRSMIEEIFKEHKPLVHFDPDRKVGQFWRAPWFGAYETHNHRMQFSDDNRTALGNSHQYFGVMFEIQLTTFSDNLYNKLAHSLLYKADPGLVTEQEEMVIDVSHGLARCFELCMRILRPKLHRDADKTTPIVAEDVDEPTEKETGMAQKVVDEFEEDLHRQSESDHVAQLLRKLLSQKEDAEDQACLRDLAASDPRDDKTRIEETKGGLLARSYEWILHDSDFQQWQTNGETQPFWITGGPGKGKTMMLCGIIDELRKKSGTNVSYFFCQGTDERINTGTAVLRGLLSLLCRQQHSLVSHIRVEYDKRGGQLFEGTNAWYALSKLFDIILGDWGLRDTYLVVDALDECLENSRKPLLKLIIQMSRKHPNVKWIVSSRQTQEFNMYAQAVTHLSLESRRQTVSEAVNAYIDCKVAEIGKQDFILSAGKRIADELKEKSEGTFLWVAIVCKELESAQDYEVMEILQEMPTGLNKLYEKLVQDIKALPRQRPRHCRSVLLAVTVAFRPLTLKELQKLVDLPPNATEDIAKMCRSFLTIRDDTVSFVHHSAKDYLLNEWSCVIRETHESMFSKSVEAMEQVLKQDIYNLRHPGISIEDVQRPSPDPLVSIQYSCVYWITHFRDAQPCSADEKVHGFLKVHFLQWFETLSLIRSALTGVHALRSLVTLCNKGARLKPLVDLASDMYRFSRSYAMIIEKAPLQAYSSTLTFSPDLRLMNELSMSAKPDWIVQKPSVDQRWDNSGCLATLVGHPDKVSSLTFSPDGHYVVSGYSHGTIKIWDAESGIETLTLQGDSGEVWSLAFDGGGKFVTSKSVHGSTRTWDAETGVCISTFGGADKPTDGVIISPDKQLTALCLADGEISIADTVSNAEVLILLGHESRPTSVDFSHDGRLIVSGSGDRTVRIWNAATGDIISTIQGHNQVVSSVCISPDAKHIASGTADGTIKIWNVSTSRRGWGPSGYRGWPRVTAVALSPDGNRIASGDIVKVSVWDAKTGHKIRMIGWKFDTEICSVTFSPDNRRIAAAGRGEGVTVIFDAKSDAGTQILGLACDGPLALSLDGRYVATSSRDTVMIKDSKNDQDAEGGQDVVTLRGHTGDITSLTFSTQNVDIVASASYDKTIKIWNVSIGAEISTLHIGVNVRPLKFDPTGAFLQTGSPLPSRDFTWSLDPSLSHTEVVLPQLRQAGYSVNMDYSWVTWNGQNILWVPPEFRGTVGPWTVYDSLPHMISMGCFSGRVWWLTFSSDYRPFAL